MAALDRRNLNLDDFVGLNWSCWVDRVNILSSDAGCNAEGSENGTGGPETMTLRKEDMHIFGRCPAHDEFFLVVCSHCGLVVKPQAFEKHCEKWHGPVMWMCGQSPAQAAQQRPPPSSSASSGMRRQKDGGGVSPVASGHRSRPSKDLKETVSLSSLKFSEEKPSLLHPSCSTPHPRVPPRLPAPPPPGHSSSSSSSTPLSEKPSVQKPPAGPSTEPPCSLRGIRTYGRTNKSLNKKESEPNKLCSGLDPEKKKVSSQESICNTDSFQQQQQPNESGKSQAGDEQRAASEQLLVKSKHKNDGEEKRSTQGGSFSFSTNILRSKNPPESFPSGKGGSSVEVEVKPQFSFNHGLLSSEGSEEEEEEEEAADLPATAWHPKPLGLCTFGCRTLGCSIFTFDRRLHRLRFALSAMLERHVNAHMWKKMPQVSSGLRSHRVTAPIIGPAVRTEGEKLSRPAGSLCLQSTSVGKLETKSHQNSHGTKRPYSSTATRPPPGRRCDLAGKPGAAGPRKEAADPRRGGEDKSSGHIRDRPLHEKSQPRAFFSSSSSTSSEAAARGSPPHAKKPCRPLSLNPPECSALPAPTRRAPRSRRRPPGAQCNVLDYDRRPFVQKHKGSGDSLPAGSQLSKTPKYKCLPSPSRSSMVSIETIEDVLGWGLEKRADV